MEWIHTISIIIIVIACAYSMHRDILLDIETQSARTDKLYQMFIDLIKDGRK